MTLPQHSPTPTLGPQPTRTALPLRTLPSCCSSPFAGVRSGPSPLHGAQTTPHSSTQKLNFTSPSPMPSKTPSLRGSQPQPGPGWMLAGSGGGRGTLGSWQFQLHQRPSSGASNASGAGPHSYGWRWGEEGAPLSMVLKQNPEPPSHLLPSHLWLLSPHFCPLLQMVGAPRPAPPPWLPGQVQAGSGLQLPGACLHSESDGWCLRFKDPQLFLWIPFPTRLAPARAREWSQGLPPFLAEHLPPSPLTTGRQISPQAGQVGEGACPSSLGPGPLFAHPQDCLQAFAVTILSLGILSTREAQGSPLLPFLATSDPQSWHVGRRAALSMGAGAG